jgi:hypothetical protein
MLHSRLFTFLTTVIGREIRTLPGSRSLLAVTGLWLHMSGLNDLSSSAAPLHAWLGAYSRSDLYFIIMTSSVTVTALRLTKSDALPGGLDDELRQSLPPLRPRTI